MRTCKRCKTNEAEKGSLNCEKCNERNRKHTAKLTAESKAKNLHIPVVSKSLADYGAYGGLGSEWEKGVAGHLENLLPMFANVDRMKSKGIMYGKPILREKRKLKALHNAYQ